MPLFYGNMEAHGLLRPFGFLRKKLYVVVMKHGHIDMIAHDFRRAPPICMSQHQDRSRNTGAAQLDGFVQTGPASWSAPFCKKTRGAIATAPHP